jgi:hypothetical protein
MNRLVLIVIIIIGINVKSYSQGTIVFWNDSTRIDCGNVSVYADSLLKKGDTLAARNLYAYLYIDFQDRYDTICPLALSKIIELDSVMTMKQLWSLLVDERCDGVTYPICEHFSVSCAIKALQMGDSQKAEQALDWIFSTGEEFYEREDLSTILKRYPELINTRIKLE